MKTQEEIDEVYKRLYFSLDDSPHYYTWVRGYTQCQEDMTDKKYTEKQLLDAMSFAECYIIEHDKPLFLKSDGKPVPDCLEYIKSLNKQY
jgi:hypothetical protein